MAVSDSAYMKELESVFSIERIEEDEFDRPDVPEDYIEWFEFLRRLRCDGTKHSLRRRAARLTPQLSESFCLYIDPDQYDITLLQQFEKEDLQQILDFTVMFYGSNHAEVLDSSENMSVEQLAKHIKMIRA